MYNKHIQTLGLLKMKQRGFTLIEMMVAVIFLLCIVMLFAGVGAGVSGNSKISWGVNGMTESRCIDGYKFIVSQDGNARQILDEFGKGARCYPNPEPGKPGSFGQM